MKDKFYGVNKYSNKIRDACQVNATAFDNSECSDFDKNVFITWWDKNCKNKKNCVMNNLSELKSRLKNEGKGKGTNGCRDIRNDFFL